MNKGLFVVLEGIDGSGKSTQAQRLQTELKKKGKEAEYIHFPNYNTPSGRKIASYLCGEQNGITQGQIAIMYAMNRWELRETLLEMIDRGVVIICDRYSYSNYAYTCAKGEASKDFGEWVLSLDSYMPTPDITLFLDVPIEHTIKQLTKNRNGEERGYLNGKTDIHESSIEYQKKVREQYLYLCENKQDIYRIDCSDNNGNMATEDKIFSLICKKLRNLFADI